MADRKRRNRKGSRARAKAKAKRWQKRLYSHASSRQARKSLDDYEKLVIRVRDGYIDARLKLAQGTRGPGMCFEWHFESVSYDHAKGDWAYNAKQTASDLRRDEREARVVNASYSEPKWDHNRAELYRIDYLGTPYALIRLEGRAWEVHYFPGPENRKLAVLGQPCEGEHVPVLTTGRTGLAEGLEIELPNGQLIPGKQKGDRVALSNAPLSHQSPAELKRMFRKFMHKGRDPAKWNIDPQRAARIGRPRRPLRDAPPLTAPKVDLFVAIGRRENIARGADNVGDAHRHAIAFELATF